MSEPDSVFWSHYIDEKNTPLFPFGFGLSYSNFEYSNITASKNILESNQFIEVSVMLKNNSSVPGREVVQLYTRDMIGSLTRPVKELKGFELIDLGPFESKRVTFKIDERMLAFYTANNKWETEEGLFKVFIGGSSDAKLETEIYFKK